MKLKPVPVVVALGIATSIACFGGGSSAPANDLKIKIRMVNLGLSTNAASLYRLDQVGGESLLIPPVETSTISPYVDANLMSEQGRYLTYRAKVDGETIVEAGFSAEKGTWHTLALVQPSPGTTLARVFPVDLTIPSGLRWNFCVAHMSTGYAGSIDVFVIRAGQTLATAERVFTNISQYAASRYQLDHIGGVQLAFCPTGTRQNYLTIPFPVDGDARQRRFTVFFRGTGPGEGGFSAVVARD